MQTSTLDTEIAYVLFIDIVSLSRYPMEEQARLVQILQDVVRGTTAFQQTAVQRDIVARPTGDGMALVFFRDPTSPLRYATEIATALRDHPKLTLRMGIHSGPVYRAKNINNEDDVAGDGILIAQRVMDVGDAGHILASDTYARFLMPLGEWASHFSLLGEFTIKHDQRLVVWNYVTDTVGNPNPPSKRAVALVRVPTSALKDGGRLASLELQGIGPAKKLKFEPAERLNIVTGDNGLGKTFLLECAWWALTEQWPDMPAYPRTDAEREEVKIIFGLEDDSAQSSQETVRYDWHAQNWPPSATRTLLPGLCLYARVDGSFSLWDPARERRTRLQGSEEEYAGLPVVLTRDQIWNGLAGPRSGNVINGLVDDWVLWQSNPQRYTQFDVFKQVLARLSPPDGGDLGKLEPGEPQRLPFDSREIPTLKHPYGEVPILHASAGVRRILTLAYIIVWAWTEHLVHSRHIRQEPQHQMILLMDEVEAHLHPQWQRVLLPALLDIHQRLASQLNIQIIVATHSPLVLASVEPEFDAHTDKLFHLDLVKKRRAAAEVELKEVPFVKRGRADLWLMTDVFGLKQPRSLEAEEAIEKATALQLEKTPAPEAVRKVNSALIQYLAQDDDFWPLWRYFAKQHGVER